MAWLPTTIPRGTLPACNPALAATIGAPHGPPVISLYGYAAPWKDPALLYAAAQNMNLPARIVVAGDLWDDPDLAGMDLRHATTPVRVGSVEFVVVPGYLSAPDRAALVHASHAAVFPYRPHASFQGSGAIADYLAHGKPVIATDVANMAELAGDAGTIVPPGDVPALAAALDAVAGNTTTAPDLARRANITAHRFTAAVHSDRCLALYQDVLRHRPTVTP